MNKLLLGSALTALAAATPAAAQQLPPAVVAVVNIDQILETCTVCAAANAQLQAQATQLQQRAQQLQTQIQNEEQALNAAVGALPQGTQPDAALQARIRTFQTMQQNAQNEVSSRRDQIQRNLAYVRQQEGARIRPAIMQVMQQRGATLVVDRGSAVEVSPALDVTPAVLAIVNQNTAPLSVNAPAQAAPPAPTPTAPPPAQPNRPRPQGR
jgi:Skp family chaperone for outer membrane proteins